VNSSSRIAQRQGVRSQKADSTFDGVPGLPEIMCRLASSNREDEIVATTALRLSYREKTCQEAICAESNSKPELEASVGASQTRDERMGAGRRLIAVVGADLHFVW
jgi:hypothetical protein